MDFILSFSEYGINVPADATGEVDVLCPKCSHARKKKNDRCLSVDIDSGIWLCHHCGWSGIADRVKWAKPRYKASHDKKFVLPEYEAPNVLPADLLRFFFDRKISIQTLQNEKIGYEKGWIKFPYYIDGTIVNIKSRKVDDKQFYQEKGARKVLYGMAEVLSGDSQTPLIWVEGEIDRLSVLEAGYKYVVSPPNGAPPLNAKNIRSFFDYLQDCEGYINKFESHIIAVDSDPPGKFLQDELARRLGVEKCRRVTWPIDCKDANDVLVKHNDEVLRNHIDNARFFPVEGLFEVKDILSDAMRLYDKGINNGVSTGWKSVDKHVRIRRGELCVLTGIPMSGKSSWLDALTLNIAEAEGWRIGVFSPENAPLSQHFKKLSEMYIGKPFLKAGQSERMSPEEVLQAGRFLQKHYYFISPDEDMFTIDDILSRARVLVFRHGIEFLIIDPYNDIDQSRLRDDNISRQAGTILSKCQRFARKNAVFVCIVAHPIKLPKETDGTYRCPTPYDISDSANFRNRPDICLAVHRPNMIRDYIELHIQKMRFREVGKLGKVRLDYARETGRFFEHNSSINAAKHVRQAAINNANKELKEARKAHERGCPND
jgi:twinkle protein